jgi:hypothetical protein
VEEWQGVAGERISMQDDNVPFEELVSLVARQEKLKGGVVEDDRVLLNKFAGITQVLIFWPGEFMSAKKPAQS